METESVHLRVRVPVPDYRRLHFTAESDAGGHVNAHGTHTFSRGALISNMLKQIPQTLRIPKFSGIPVLLKELTQLSKCAAVNCRTVCWVLIPGARNIHIPHAEFIAHMKNLALVVG